jgi:hypothetical protein
VISLTGKGEEMVDKDAYYGKVEAELRNWDTEIRKLREKTRRIDEGGKVVYYDQVEDLMALHELALQKLQELKDSEEEHWDYFRRGMDSVLSDLKKSHEELTAHFSSISPDK